MYIEVMNNKNFSIYAVLILALVIFEGSAQYHIKKSRQPNGLVFLFVGIFCYSVVCLLLHKCYAFEGMGMTNFVWSIMSIISMMAIGYIAFNEEINKYDVIGFGLCSIGLYFIFLYGHGD